MKIYKTCYFFSDANDGTIWGCDTIEYEGSFWLVAYWLENKVQGLRKPGRLICIDTIRHQKANGKPWDFVLNVGIPKALFDGQIPPQSGDKFAVIENPDITFPLPNKT